MSRPIAALLPSVPPEGPLPLGHTLYLAPPERLPELLADLGPISALQGRLVAAEGPPRPTPWVRAVWPEPLILPALSIGRAADGLRALQRNWWLHPLDHHRRAALIQERLPVVRAKPLHFPQPLPMAPLGGWTLPHPQMLLASPGSDAAMPEGEILFVPDREGPPARAYLKLWEALTRLGVFPQTGETALDLGAAPGGWTWALARLGVRVTAVDKAALDPRVAAMPGVQAVQGSAFALDPLALPAFDWWVCDVICYPERLARLFRLWRDSGRARRMIATMKFQGDTDHATLRSLGAEPGVRVLHLSANKHEAMLLWTA